VGTLQGRNSGRDGLGQVLEFCLSDCEQRWFLGAHYFGANKLLPDKSNGTNCCCEYVGSAGLGHPTVLADYFVKIVPHSDLRPIEDVCAPYALECPADNATASRVLGNPFIEVYERPWALRRKEAVVKEEKVLQISLASFATASCMLLLCLSICKCLTKHRLSMELDDVNQIEGLDVDHSAIKRIKFTVPKIEKDNDGDDDDAGTPSTLSPSSSVPHSPRATTSSGSWIFRSSSGFSPGVSLGSFTKSPPSNWFRRFTDSASPSGGSSLKVPLVGPNHYV